MKHSKIIPAFFVVGVRDFVFSKELESFLRSFPVSGIALFNSPFDSPLNIWQDPASALEAIYEFIQKASRYVSFFAADQEGGRVRRLRSPFLSLPSAEKMADALEETQNFSLIENLYRLAAEQMALTGIHLNFAPVCDIRTSETNDVIGDRSFGDSAEKIQPFIERFCKAFESSGVHTTLKHFPGHGPTRLDSHEEIALVFKRKEELFREDRNVFLSAAPFASALLTAHIAFEDEPHRIFSLDRELIDEFKKGISKDLILITDDLLSMKAVSAVNPWRQALDCQYDLILVCGSLDQATIAIEDTIRYSESLSQTFDLETQTERRSQKAAKRFEHKIEFESFPKWKAKILDRTERGSECLEKLKIKV
jgi:beta-N-acetylhexosaminidase